MTGYQQKQHKKQAHLEITLSKDWAQTKWSLTRMHNTPSQNIILKKNRVVVQQSENNNLLSLQKLYNINFFTPSENLLETFFFLNVYLYQEAYIAHETRKRHKRPISYTIITKYHWKFFLQKISWKLCWVEKKLVTENLYFYFYSRLLTEVFFFDELLSWILVS